MIPAFTECPADDEIAAHLTGQLGEQQADAMRNHLDSCDSCRSLTIALVRARGTPAPNTLSGSVALDSLPAVAPIEPSLAGSNIGRYQIQHAIGSGGMGVVYAAHDPSLHRSVALKVLKPELARLHPVLTDRLMKESRLLARVSDPAVITVFDAGMFKDQVFLAMELIDGETLGDWARRNKSHPINSNIIIDIFLRAGAGLLAAHRAGVLHRDFKPDNVLLAPANVQSPKRVIVTDFGLARDQSIESATAIDSPSSHHDASRSVDIPLNILSIDITALTVTGMAVGTPAYMSPEQLTCQAVDVRSDIFAMGVSMWELLYGERPFFGQTAVALRESIERGPSLSKAKAEEIAPGNIPSALHSLVKRMVAYDPERRPQTMDSVLADLQRCIPTPRSRRRFVLAAGALLAGTAIAGVTVTMMQRQHSRDRDPCRLAQSGLENVWNAETSGNVQARLAATGASSTIAAASIASLNAWAESIAQHQQMICKQPENHVGDACLQARLNELAAVTSVVSNIESDNLGAVRNLLNTKLEPTVCSSAGVSVGESRWPMNPALWTPLANIRSRFVAIEQMRNRGQLQQAHTAILALADDAQALHWPAVEAEQQYLLGSIEDFGIAPANSMKTYGQAAALAESSRADYVAATIWNAMSGLATLKETSPQRGLAYASYAAAASTRIGKPPSLEAMILYQQATANIQLAKFDLAASQLNEAITIAENAYPELVATLVQGMGFVHENRGEYQQAVESYRKAIAIFEERGEQESLAAIICRTRLSSNLGQLQQTDAALAEATAVTTLADRVLSEQSADRMRAHANRAGTLGLMARNDDALVEVEIAIGLARLQAGERSDDYGKLLGLKAGILLANGDADTAATLATQSCEIQAFKNGDDALDTAMCWADSATTLNDVGKFQMALSRIDKTLPTLEAVFKPEQAEIFTVMISKATALAGLRRYSEAAPLYEIGIASMIKGGYDPGFIADSEFKFAMALRNTNVAKAHALVTSALARWAAAPVGWQQEILTAQKWLRVHPQ